MPERSFTMVLSWTSFFIVDKSERGQETPLLSGVPHVVSLGCDRVGAFAALESKQNYSPARA
jgi:hypothetical protein